MLTNEKIAAIHANAVAHGFWKPDSEPTFGEYCALIHEEISEAFSAWRNGEPDEYVVDGKPEGVWVELADVVIRIGDLFGRAGTIIHEDDDRRRQVYDNTRNTILEEPHESFAEFVTTLHDLISLAHKAIDSEITEYTLLSAVVCIYARAELENIDIDAIIDRKCAYNATRTWRHEKRM